MTFYLPDDPEPGPANPAPAPNSSAIDVLGAAWDATGAQENSWGRNDRIRREIFAEIEARIGSFEAEMPVEPSLDVTEIGLEPHYQGYAETDYARRPYVERQVLARAGRFAAQRPADYGGLPLDEQQLEAELNRRLEAEWREDQAVMQAGGWGSGAAEFAGGMARSATGGSSVAFMLAGGPTFRPGIAGAARFMGIEGLLGAASEAFVLPQQWEQADRLGIPQPDALEAITTGFVASAGLAGIGAAAVRGFTYLTGRAAGEAELRPAGADPYDAQAAVDAAEAALREGRPAPLSQIGPGVDQRARDALGRLEDVAGPLNIISDFRTPEENAAAGGARGSQHLHGRAFDVDVSGLSIPERQELIRRARAAGFSGIGVYENSLHFDVGGDRAWGPSYRRDSLPAWAAEAIGAPVGQFAHDDFDAVAGRIIGAESGGRADARNPNSSATGAGQFLDATWLELVGRTRPDLIEGRSQAEVLAMRGDRALARQMVAAYARENAALLAAEGLPTDPGSLYLAHFLGPGGAAQALRADPGAHVSAVMTPEQLRANAAVRYGGKSLAEFSVGDLRRWAEVKVGTAVDPGLAWRPAGPHGYTQAGQVTTPAGTRIDVAYEVVDASSLIPASGDLQPRDRSRAASDEQIAEIAARLDPARLMPSPETDRGAPLVGPDGVIESGNGRVRSILRAAEMHPDRYEAYRAAIAEIAPIPEGVETPVLIARRTTELDDAARVRLVQESNTSSIARMSGSEQAAMEGRAIEPVDLELYDPAAPLASAENRAFAARLLSRLPQAERAALVTERGALNAQGARRLREALFARAYDAPDLTRVLAEDEGGDLRQLAEALADVAPRWAMLRDEIAAGRLAPELDVTPQLAQAARLVARARAQARTTKGLTVRAALADALAQVDVETGPVDAVTEQLVGVLTRDGRARSQEDVAALLGRYVDEAFAVGDTQARLFAETGDAAPEEILHALARTEIRADADPNAPGGAGPEPGDAGGGDAPGGPGPDDGGRGAGGGGAGEPPAGGGGGRGGDGEESVEDLIARGASPEELAAHPEIADALARLEEVPRTDLQEGYGTDAYFETRIYRAKTQELLGIEPAVDYLLTAARRLAWTEDGLDPPATVRQDRQATILIGAPASGKSTVANPLARALQATIVDADEAKKIVPEYQGGIGANAVHEESSALADEVLARAVLDGDNLVLPKVGGKAGSIEKLTARLKAEGYSVNVALVDVPADEAWRRMIGRWRATGRIIPPGFMAEAIDGPPRTYDVLKSKGAADGFARIDNSPGLGEPRRILEDPQGIVPADLGGVGSVRRDAVRPGDGPGEGAARPEGRGQEGLASPDIRQADDALFGAGSASPEVDAANRAALADFRARLEAEGDFEIATGRMTDGPDGPIPEIVSARQLLDEIEDEQDLAEVISACALPQARSRDAQSTAGGRPKPGGAGDA